ncbi:MAG TPA: TIGR02281 family clan AA aspartic protease [Novosphingobium sp.]|nr:TIGR02281 family clan AA aspartic protease [Novosphingobium sp.]
MDGLFDLPWLAALLRSPLLAAALIAMACAFVGSLVARSLPRGGRILRLGGNLALAAVLVLTAAQFARVSNPSLELALPRLGLPAQTVEGAETHVTMAEDGHFWIEALVNGEPRRFLVDTGATLTAVSVEFAAASGVEPTAGRMPVQLRTANGSMPANLATIDRLAFGNIVARDLDAVIAPGIGDMNVLGMNFLSRLKSWRVEDGELILVPHHPQATPAS